MANQIQHVQYEGHLVEDPDLHYTPSGKMVANFRIGSNREYKNANGEKVTEVTWLKIVAWGNLAEIVHNLCAKGSHVIVEGILRPGKSGNPEPYELKAGGWGASFEITADKVRVLKGKPMGSDESVPQQEEDDLPF